MNIFLFLNLFRSIFNKTWSLRQPGTEMPDYDIFFDDHGILKDKTPGISKWKARSSGKIEISINNNYVNIDASIYYIEKDNTLNILGRAKNINNKEWIWIASRPADNKDADLIKMLTYEIVTSNGLKCYTFPVTPSTNQQTNKHSPITSPGTQTVQPAINTITNVNIFSTTKMDTNSILHLGLYHPYRGGSNPKFDDFSSKILALKNGNSIAINYFFEKLINYFQGTFTIVTIPSHDPEKTMSGIRMLALKIVGSRNNMTIDGTSCLIRKIKIAKLASGGDRSVENQLKSLDVKNQHLIQGKIVLLLDDVTTTNHSLIAGRKKLLEAGANLVQAFALAKTC